MNKTTQLKEKFKTKAQLNWEFGKAEEERFIEILAKSGLNIIDGEDPYDIQQLFAQIRQNEYRRGKEDSRQDALKEELEFLESLLNKLKQKKQFYKEQIIMEDELLPRISQIKEELK